MIPISASRQSIAIVPSSAAIQHQIAIPTGAPGRTLVGAEAICGATLSSATAMVITISRALAATPTVFVTLGTITWSATQAAWTGVYTDILPLAPPAVAMAAVTATGNPGNLALGATGNTFGPGDVLKCEVTTAATDASTGTLTLFWE
jgi:hypothetical protein